MTSANLPDQDELKRINEILLRVCGSEENRKAWLDAPHPDLGMRTPQECIDVGYTTAVLNMLEAAIIGLPT